jgi:hypothetical protein
MAILRQALYLHGVVTDVEALYLVITISSVSNNGYCELESRLWFKTHSNHLSLDKEIAVKAPGVIEPLFFILIVFLLKQRWKLNTLTATLFLNL